MKLTALLVVMAITSVVFGQILGHLSPHPLVLLAVFPIWSVGWAVTVSLLGQAWTMGDDS